MREQTFDLETFRGIVRIVRIARIHAWILVRIVCIARMWAQNENSLKSSGVILQKSLPEYTIIGDMPFNEY